MEFVYKFEVYDPYDSASEIEVVGKSVNSALISLIEKSVDPVLSVTLIGLHPVVKL